MPKVKMIKVVVIDPATRTIEDREITADLDGFYTAIGCDLIQAAPVAPGVVAWVDEEGLINGRSPHLTLVRGFHQPLAGRIVLASRALGSVRGDAASLSHLVSWVR